MRRVLAVAAITAIAIPAFADSELMKSRITGVNHAAYHVANGKLAPSDGARRSLFSIWDMTVNSGSYWGSMANDTLPLDWGDIGDGSVVGGFAFAYAVPITLGQPETIHCAIVFYSDYNGFNNNGFYATFGFDISNLPTTVNGDNGWVTTVDLTSPGDPNNDLSFTMAGNDLDDDGKADFGYSYWFPDRVGQGHAIGPFLVNYDTALYPRDDNHVGDPNYLYAPDTALWEDLGAEEGFDRFADPNTFNYLGTSWFGGWTPGDPNTVFSQFYMELFQYHGIPCGAPGDSGMFCTGDIAVPWDCAVGLDDLAVLLSAYGVNADGDIEPPGGDGDTDLQDLAALLAQYGDDCHF